MRTIQDLLSQSKHALNAHGTLRELAAWYRGFAERAEIWGARLQTAEDLEAEAKRLERRDRLIDPGQGLRTPLISHDPETLGTDRQLAQLAAAAQFYCIQPIPASRP